MMQQLLSLNLFASVEIHRNVSSGQGYGSTSENNSHHQYLVANLTLLCTLAFFNPLHYHKVLILLLVSTKHNKTQIKRRPAREQHQVRTCLVDAIDSLH